MNLINCSVLVKQDKKNYVFLKGCFTNFTPEVQRRGKEGKRGRVFVVYCVFFVGSCVVIVVYCVVFAVNLHLPFDAQDPVGLDKSDQELDQLQRERKFISSD